MLIVSPAMMQDFDVVVIGTGAAGTAAALACAQVGRKVAIVDKRPFGGTCALRGCDPKKVLVGAEEIVHRYDAIRNSQALTGQLAIDWPALIRFKRTFTEPVPAERESTYREAGIATFHGAAHFTDASTIAVNDELLRAASIVIATGAHPAGLGIQGEEHVRTSDQFLDLQTLPQSIVFIGGGYISFEFAHVAARSGAKVTILHRGIRPLEQFDSDLVARLVDASKAAGIDVQLQTPVQSVEPRGSAFAVHAGEKTYVADLVVHGAGRVPELEDLDLKTGQVTQSKKGIIVNAFLQSESNPKVFAAGDSADSGGLPLTPVAAFTGEVAAHNILNGNARQARFEAIPSLVFTNPILGSVGARENDVDSASVSIQTGDMAQWYSYRRVGEKYATYKILVDRAEDRVLGAHILGPGAEELVNVFALAIWHRTPVAQLRDAIFGYPTYSSDITYML